MKKFLVFLVSIVLFTGLSANADDIDLPSGGDLWDNWTMPSMEPEVKPVSDEEFDKAIEQVDSKVNKWKNRFKKWQQPRGKEFSQSNESETIKTEEGIDASLPVLCVPVELVSGQYIIPVGHYQIKGEKIDGMPVLKFYQAHYELAQIPATETNDDFGEEVITFAKWEPSGDDKIKIMYGSLDMNAYAFVKISNP